MGWNGYLSNETRQQVVGVLIEERLTTRDHVVVLLNALPKRFLAQLPAAGGLRDDMRLTSELNHINGISMLTGGEVPMRVFLSNTIAMVQDKARQSVVQNALLELENNPPTSSTRETVRGISGKTRSHSRFDTFSETVAKRKSTSEEVTLESLPRGPVGEITRELTILRDEKLPIDFVQRATDAANSVFKLIVHRHFDGIASMLGEQADAGTGTAWVIGQGIGITNHHVFEARDPSEPPAAEADFNAQINTAMVIADYFDADVEQNGLTLGENPLLASNKELDYAIFKLPPALKYRIPLPLVPQPLLKSATAPVHSRVNVIQHPHGLPMQLAIRNNYIMSGDEQHLTYLSDTEAGSSGSPVMDDNWRVAALHVGGRKNEALEFELLGRPIEHENIGVAIEAVLLDILGAAPNAHATITA